VESENFKCLTNIQITNTPQYTNYLIEL